MASAGVSLRKRVVVLFVFSSVLLALLVGRVAYIQFLWGEELKKKALEVRMRDIPVAAKRGAILDRRGRELAVSVSVESVYAFPAQVKEPEKSARTLADILNMPYEEVYGRLTRVSSFEWIRRKIEPEQAKRIREARLKGVDLTPESKRYYPKANLASHVLGISGIDNQGLEGLEVTYDSQLRGTPGRIIIEMDGLGRELPQATHRYDPPVEGHSLILTIDEVIQFIAERELERAMARTQAKGGTVVVMDPATGEILAMAARPDYDPNRYGDFPDKNRRNPAISDTYPPGSTFKPVTASAALEEGVTSLHDRFYCGGSIKVPGHTITCWLTEGHGSQSFLEVVQNSCNPGFVTLGLRVGAQRFYSYLEAFGLTEPTGVDLPGEGVGLTIKPQEIKPVDLAVMSFGQTLTVTPIQLITAMAAIANDGVLMQPHLVREIRSSSGGIAQSLDPVVERRVISVKTAQEMKQALEQVVEKGTGRQARIDGYRLAGKTGTANKVIGGRIAEGKYISSFVGFGPVEKPRVIALITIDEPVGEYYGGLIAAPVFGGMIGDILRYLEVPPKPRQAASNASKKPVAAAAWVPNVANLPLEDAREAVSAAGLSLRVEGSGNIVEEQEPAAGTEVPPNSTVRVKARPAIDPAQPGYVYVPSVVGKTIKEATATLGKFGLKIEVEGSGFAVSQDPAPGSAAPQNQAVKVSFRAPE
ncbi:MAG: stage V sporulation protein D [Firmicutes bacterium]|nr:stage V sporulation protein D [Bacillota bacterium]